MLKILFIICSVSLVQVVRGREFQSQSPLQSNEKRGGNLQKNETEHESLHTTFNM